MMEDMPVREMTIHEEITALKEYDVPELVIKRIIMKLTEQDERDRRIYADQDKTIARLYDMRRNDIAVIDALGAYLAIQDERKGF